MAYEEQVLVCNEAYYRYQAALNNYSDDDPFAEPTLIYSNINGGLGVFGAYTISPAVASYL